MEQTVSSPCVGTLRSCSTLLQRAEFRATPAAQPHSLSELRVASMERKPNAWVQSTPYGSRCRCAAMDSPLKQERSSAEADLTQRPYAATFLGARIRQGGRRPALGPARVLQSKGGGSDWIRNREPRMSRSSANLLALQWQRRCWLPQVLPRVQSGQDSPSSFCRRYDDRIHATFQQPEKSLSRKFNVPVVCQEYDEAHPLGPA